MGDGLDLAYVYAERGLYQLLAVARYSACRYFYIRRHMRIKLRQSPAHGRKRLADARQPVLCEEQFAIFTDQHELCRRRADVDAEIGVSLVILHINALRAAAGMLFPEGGQLRVALEKRRAAAAALVAVRDEEAFRPPLQSAGFHRVALLRAYRRAHRYEEVRVPREDALLRR